MVFYAADGGLSRAPFLMRYRHRRMQIESGQVCQSRRTVRNCQLSTLADLEPQALTMRFSACTLSTEAFS